MVKGSVTVSFSEENRAAEEADAPAIPLEIIRPRRAGSAFEHALLDFDGTLSLIREGWQQIMIPYFAQTLAETPGGRDESFDALLGLAREFVFLHTGKQTIYQCIALGEEVAKLGGKAGDPQAYKDEYLRRLLEHIGGRLRGLRNGDADPESLTVPGSRRLLEALRSRGIKLYLASGTDEQHVREEAALLKLDGFFEGRIFGAQRDYKSFSKKMVIERILTENRLSGEGLLGFGDGFVEIENVKSAGGTAIGVASNETERRGIDRWKRERLIRAGADAIIPDYAGLRDIEAYLFA